MHIPVLQKEVLKYLDPKPNENFVDCTIDGGGHSKAILEKIKPDGKVLGIEWDKEICQKIKLDRLILINDSYVNLKEIVKDFGPINGILFDLGMSSWHIDESGKGFSFLKDEPLDMRYSLDNELTAEYIVNNYSFENIEKILREYGEERFSRKIAKAIIDNRPIKTTFQLKDIIRIPRSKIHPATRTFQALRIAVNDELGNIEKALPQAEEILSPGGRLVVISFHSLEDRIVKNFFKNSKIEILTKKPITSSLEELKNNPRSRPAKLRAGIKQ
jgi:16S rRNA (cytosine1402-N4)-methyltransferase